MSFQCSSATGFLASTGWGFRGGQRSGSRVGATWAAVAFAGRDSGPALAPGARPCRHRRVSWSRTPTCGVAMAASPPTCALARWAGRADLLDLRAAGGAAAGYVCRSGAGITWRQAAARPSGCYCRWGSRCRPRTRSRARRPWASSAGDGVYPSAGERRRPHGTSPSPPRYRRGPLTEHGSALCQYGRLASRVRFSPRGRLLLRAVCSRNSLTRPRFPSSAGRVRLPPEHTRHRRHAAPDTLRRGGTQFSSSPIPGRRAAALHTADSTATCRALAGGRRNCGDGFDEARRVAQPTQWAGIR